MSRQGDGRAKTGLKSMRVGYLSAVSDNLDEAKALGSIVAIVEYEGVQSVLNRFSGWKGYPTSILLSLPTKLLCSQPTRTVWNRWDTDLSGREGMDGQQGV